MAPFSIEHGVFNLVLKDSLVKSGRQTRLQLLLIYPFASSKMSHDPGIRVSSLAITSNTQLLGGYRQVTISLKDQNLRTVLQATLLHFPSMYLASVNTDEVRIHIPPKNYGPPEQLFWIERAESSSSEPSLMRFFISDRGIHEYIIKNSIVRILGLGSQVAPGYNSDGNPGYWIKAFQPPTYSAIQRLQKESNFHLARITVEHVVEKCGWQIGSERFLWDKGPSIKLVNTDRGLLGRGSIGVVEEVRVPGYEEPMAQKRIFISRPRRQAAQDLDQIRKEIDHLKSLDHAHIVKAVGCYPERRGESTVALCALLHPAGDEDLAFFLDEVVPSASDWEQMMTYRSWIRTWFYSLASALAYMHSKGIHHEDIKPSNIVHRNGTIFFTDFSSARKLESMDDTSTASPALASRMYAAPEVFSGDSGNPQRHGSQTDVFSLGLVFIEMYTVLCGSSLSNLHSYMFGDLRSGREYHRVIHKFGQYQVMTELLRAFKPCLEWMFFRQDISDTPEIYAYQIDLEYT
ncbi:kinase-like protein [Pyrenochaeta sp. DS3sAY3a]|nr:kinase-like protein [Pyrenochaeta sp. DS3sAY3a]